MAPDVTEIMVMWA